MTMNRKFKSSFSQLIAFALILFCILFVCVILVITGIVTPSLSGFAVDSSDRLYIGMQKEICVYEEGSIIRRINPHTSRTYIFTITENDTILLSTSTKIYVMDLYGNILEEREDVGADTYNQLSYKKRRFVSHSGDVYTLKGIIGPTRIVKNNFETVYQIDALSFSVKVCLWLCGVGLAVLSLTCLSTKKQSQN